MSDSTQIVCAHCGAINRVPVERAADAAKCGQCSTPLFSGHPADVSGDMLLRQMNKGSLPVVVDVWAPWCGPCRVMAPEYEKAAAALEPRARFLKLNSDNEQALASQFNIRGIPTMILFRAGREVDRVSGAMRAGDIASWVSAHL